jgi:hypothetical protein
MIRPLLAVKGPGQPSHALGFLGNPKLPPDATFKNPTTRPLPSFSPSPTALARHIKTVASSAILESAILVKLQYQNPYITSVMNGVTNGNGLSANKASPQAQSSPTMILTILQTSFNFTSESVGEGHPDKIWYVLRSLQIPLA